MRYATESMSPGRSPSGTRVTAPTVWPRTTSRQPSWVARRNRTSWIETLCMAGLRVRPGRGAGGAWWERAAGGTGRPVGRGPAREGESAPGGCGREEGEETGPPAPAPRGPPLPGCAPLSVGCRAKRGCCSAWRSGADAPADPLRLLQTGGVTRLRRTTRPGGPVAAAEQCCTWSGRSGPRGRGDRPGAVSGTGRAAPSTPCACAVGSSGHTLSRSARDR